jgi:DNA-directed RNA polymerase specialized sigma24 family protein
MTDADSIVTDPDVLDLTAAKATLVAQRREFARDDPEDIQQEMLVLIWAKRALFDPDRGTMSAFAAEVADSWVKMEIRARNRIKRAGGLGAVSLERTFVECDGDLESLDRLITEADLGRRNHRLTPSPLVQVDDRDGIEHVMTRLGPGVEALLKRSAEVGQSQTARERSRELGFRVNRDHITKIQKASRPIFEDAGFSQEECAPGAQTA